ncbi:MAG: energy-coupling factor ABC transporter permease [Chloroflexota bacterium]
MLKLPEELVTAAPSPLHVPDGFMSLPVIGLTTAITVAVLAVAVWRSNRGLNERLVPLMGVMAAFIFAAQMLNFPVVGGTSGHFVGGALAAALLGLWPAVLVMTCVVALQAILFQDGGLVVLGINVFNMGVVSVLAGWLIYTSFLRTVGVWRWGVLAGGFVAAWVSVVLSALACAVELALSGTSPFQVAVPAMVGVHTLIGLGEGLITGGALALVMATHRDLLHLRPIRAGGGGQS